MPDPLPVPPGAPRAGPDTPADAWLVSALGAAPEPTPTDPEFAAAVADLLRAPLAGPAVGDLIDAYRLVEQIGAGGMGVVFRAVHVPLEKEVALKVIRGVRAADAHAVERFRCEMRAAGRLDHPNLVRATDAGACGGVQYLVMDYHPGTNLARLVARDGPFPVARACELVRQAAEGLHHAHEHGLVHRDVKPSNLLLGDDGVVRVLDLGLARLPDEPPLPAVATDAPAPSVGSTLTETGQLLGTRDYTAPEQVRDSHRVDRRADVYGLGCTLAFLLTGAPPGADRPLPPGVPRATWDRLLAADPDARFPTARAVADALAPSRGRWTAGAVVAALTIIVALAIAFAPRNGREGGAPERAPDPAPLAEAPFPRAVPPPGVLPLTAAAATALQRQWADHLRQPVVVTNSVGMELVLVPPGECAMSGIYAAVVTRPYRMGATEVTFAQFAAFARATGHQTAAERRKVGARFRTWKPLRAFPGPQDPVHRLSPGWGTYADDQPIGYLTWDDIDAFLRWLSAREGRTYRLPTHAEWVWAARAGTGGLVYWDTGGGPQHIATAPRFAWTRESGADRPMPAGRLAPNPWGLYDTIGNVEELVSDYLAVGFVPSGRALDPTGPPRTDNRLTCGGSYAEALRPVPVSELTGAAARTVVYSNQGFRVLLEP